MKSKEELEGYWAGALRNFHSFRDHWWRVCRKGILGATWIEIVGNDIYSDSPSVYMWCLGFSQGRESVYENQLATLRGGVTDEYPETE